MTRTRTQATTTIYSRLGFLAWTWISDRDRITDFDQHSPGSTFHALLYIYIYISPHTRSSRNQVGGCWGRHFPWCRLHHNISHPQPTMIDHSLKRRISILSICSPQLTASTDKRSSHRATEAFLQHQNNARMCALRTLRPYS